MDLLPPSLIVARYFADEQAEIDARQSALETAEQKLDDEYIEEHTGEDGLLADATNDSGNITQSSVNARLKALTPDLMMLNETQDNNDDECNTLEHCLSLIDAKSKADKAVKEAQLALDEQVLARYATLTETEIKQLVIDDKWFATIQAAIIGEVQRLTQNLTERVKELEERYAQPLPDLARDMDTFSAKVEAHLKSMGADWEWVKPLLTKKFSTGYKQTNLGPLPNTWEAVLLGDLFVFKNGLNKAKRFFGSGTPIVNYMDVFKRPGLRPSDLSGRVNLTPEEIRNFNVRKGDVFFTRTSETVEDIGVASVMLYEPHDTVFSGFVLRARPPWWATWWSLQSSTVLPTGLSDLKSYQMQRIQRVPWPMVVYCLPYGSLYPQFQNNAPSPKHCQM